MQIVKDVESFEALGPAWNELADCFENPLLRHEWFLSAAQAFCEPGDLSVLVLRKEDQLQAAAPLAFHNTGGVRQLEIIGAPFLSEPSGLLYTGRDTLTELIHGVVKTTRTVRLHRLESGSTELDIIPYACKGRAIVSYGSGGAAPQLAISGTWEDFEASLSSRRRSDMRRARRRADKEGNVEIEIFNPAPEETGRYITETDEVEARSWKGRNTNLQEPLFKRFRTLYARRAAKQGMLRLGFLRIDGRPISSMTALVYKNAFWVLKIEYDESHSRSSPGILLMHDSIRYAFASGLQRYEFLGNDEPWMHVWTDKLRTFRSPYIFPFSLGGVTGLTVNLSSFVARRLRQKLSRN